MSIVKVSEFKDMNEITLTATEVSTVINALDNFLFEGFSDLDVKIEYLEDMEGSDYWESTEFSSIIERSVNSITEELNRLVDLIVLITHVDPSYNPSDGSHCELYNIDSYLENLGKLRNRCAKILSSDKITTKK